MVMSDARSHAFNGSRGRYWIRPALPQDREALRRMIESESPADRRLRFFRAIHQVPDALLDPMLRDDDPRHAALVATGPEPGELVASAMLVAPRDSQAGEFGILVARRHAGQRLGTHLMECLAREAAARGLTSLFGVILAENTEMVDLARRLGFTLEPSEDPGCVKAVRRIDAGAARAQ